MSGRFDKNNFLKTACTSWAGIVLSLKVVILFVFVFCTNVLFAQTTMPLSTTGAASTISTCVSTFTDDGQGGGANRYSSGQNSILTICPSTSGAFIQVIFTVFNTQANDVLTIYNGNSTAGPVIATLTGNLNATAPFSFVSTASNGCLTFQFISDASNNSAGWAASVSCVSQQTILGCGTLNSCNSSFLDPGGNSNYSNNLNLTQTICSSNPGACLSITFSSFNLENGFDYLRIYDGSNSAAALIGSYTGTTLPPTITSSGSCLTFVFTSDGSNNAAGFMANLTCGTCATPLPPPPVPPINDDPCASISLNVGTTCSYNQFTNQNASPTACVPVPGCSSYLGGDVWFSAVVPLAGNISFDSNTGVMLDGGMAVYTGSCSNLVLFACDDDNSVNGSMPALNLTGLTPGSTVYVRFWEYGNNNNGTFSLCAFEPAPPPPAPVNDNPCNAIGLSVGTSCSYTQFTNAGATPTLGVAAPTCSFYTGGDVWFSAVVPASGNLGFDSNTGVMLDGGMAVYTGACGALIQIACDDDASANGAMPALSLTALTPGSTVYIRFWEYGNNNNGTFSLCAFEPAPPPPPPVPLVTGCSGTFTDTGGPTGNYSASENYTVTFCPDIPGARIRLSFSEFNLENDLDFLTIYDGDDITAPILGTGPYTGTNIPGVVQASLTNPTGCITVLFESDFSIQRAGWLASISCLLPCQNIVANLLSTSPMPSNDGAIRVCQGSSVNFIGSGTFSNSPTGATYNWSFGDGLPVSGANVTQIFNTPGTYVANLNIQDPSGCVNSNRLNIIVQVSTTPAIALSAGPNTLCLGQSANLDAAVTPTPFIQNCTPPLSGTTSLPDGTNVSYQTAIAVDCYGSFQVIESITDIQNICVNMEHSYLGDLDVVIRCPNGNTASLIENASLTGNYSANLGQPWATAAIDGQSTILTPGVGSTYCFSSDASLLTIPQSIVTGGTFVNGNGPATYTDSYVPAGSYETQGSLTSLIGCPLNGQWSIILTDNLPADNGNIFNWDINFNPALLPPTSITTFTPTIVSQGWQAAAGLTTTTGSSTASVTPTATGNSCYTYTVTDNFGCTYNQPACVSVNSPASALLTSAASTANQSACLNSAIASIQYTLTGVTTATVSPLPAGVSITILGNVLTISGVPTQTGTFTYHIIGGAVGCGFDVTGTITVTPPITLNITSTNPTCPSACNGSANVTIVGGTGNPADYTYSWTGPTAASGPNPSNLCVGIYNVSVSGGGCTSQSAASIPTSCFEIQSILVDACNPGSIPENIGEMVFFQVGPTGLNTASLGLTWATTTQPYNGLCTNPTFIANVNATITGGGSLVAAPAVLPPGASVVLITGNTATTSANLFTNLSSTLYVLFQCTQTSTPGHFVNGNGTGTRTFSMNFGSGCTDQVSYVAQSLIGGDGASVVYSPSGTPSYINTSCNAPFLPPTTGTIVLTSSTPDVQVTASATSICTGGSATLTATGATSYSWSPATGLSATTGASVTATPTVTATYTVTGTTGTCVESAPVTITVGTQPTATIAYPAASFCTSVTAAQSITLTGTAGGTFSAAPSGLTINATTGAITPSSSTAGAYVVTYSIPATASCPAGTATVSVAIVGIPTVTANAVTLTTCSGPTLADASAPGITLTISAGATVNWSLYSGTTATGIPIQTGTGTPNYQFTNSTCSDQNYLYQLIPTINGCNGNPLNIAVLVKPKPISSFTINPSTICVGQSAVITFTGATCPSATFTWQGLTAAGLTVTGSGIGPYTVTATTAGTYQIRVQSALGSCTGPYSPYSSLVVNPNPTATITGPTAICSGSATALNLTSTPSGATFNWTQTPTNANGSSNGSGASIAQTLTATGTTAGTVQYAVTPSLNGCTGSTVNSTVTVNIPPTATMSSSAILCPGPTGTINFTGTPSAQISWNTSIGGSGTFGLTTAGIATGGPSSFSLGTSWPAGVTISFTQVVLGSCSAPLNYTVLISSNINATVTATSPICSGTFSALTFTGPTSALVTYNLGGANLLINLGPTGTTTINSPILSSNSVVTITQVQIAGGCIAALNNSTSIVVAPANTYGTPSSSPTLCINTALTPITIATTGATGIGTPTGLPAGVNATWSGNVITISGTPSASGSFSYSIPLTGGCGVVNAMGSITVNPLQSVTLTYGGPYCVAFNSANPTNSWSGGGTYSAPAGLNINSASGIVSLFTSTPGSYLVTFTPVGCAASATATIVVNPTPIATVAPTSTICSGDVTAIALTSTPAGASFAWTQVSTGATGSSNGSGSTIAQTLTASGTTAGSVVYTIIPTLGTCAGAAVTSTVTVNPLPTVVVNSPTVCPGTPATLTATVTPAGTYNYAWTVPSGATNPSNVVTFNTTVAGSYSVIATGNGTPACASAPVAGVVTLNDIIDYANLQSPASGTICTNGSLTAYGQFYNAGTVNTPGAGAAVGATVQIGYSTANTDPSTWTNWSAATYNAAVTNNNDEYQGTLSGLAAGTYYYTFRYQINGCAWQYGGYSTGGGGFWNGTCATCNVNGVLTVTALPQAGNDNSVTLCATGNSVNLYSSLGPSAANTGAWTGASSLAGGYLGTFNPSVNSAGAYIYTVTAQGCPDDVAVVTVTLSNSPTASLVYPTPICKNETAPVNPVLTGTTGGSFSSTPAGLSLNASSGAITASSSTIGNYSITYTIAEANGCSAFSTVANVSIIAAPAVPTLAPTPACTNTTTFTAGGGAWYEFLVNGTSQGAASATTTLNAASGFAAGTQVCVRSYLAPPVMDGALTDALWGAEIAGSTGGALSSFGANRIDGLKLLNRNGILYGAVAGTEEDGVAENLNNRIALFIDCRAGGFNNLAAWTPRTGANSNTGGLTNLNNGIVFDTGFEADYILTMNRYNGQTFYDLYDMLANTNNYLGSGPSAQFGFQQNTTEGDLTKGFEFSFPLSSLGNPSGVMKVFGMLINDPPGTATTTISNQFITPANLGENSYGDVAVFFNNAAPNPVLYKVTQDCYEQTCVTVQPSAIPNFVLPSPLCYGAPAPVLSTTSPNGISGTWSPTSVSTTTPGTGTTPVATNYIFTPTAGGCSQPQSVSITILPQILTTLIFHN